MSSWSRSRYQGSCRDDDSVSSLQAGLRAHCTVCGGMLTHTDICCWSAHFRGCCCHSIAGSISPVTRSVTCVAPATGAPLLPGPAACAARRARTGHPPSLHQHQPGRHQRSFFRSSYNLVCVCLHTDNTQLCPVCGDCGVFGVCMESCPSLHPGIVCYLCQYRGGQCGLGSSTQETRNYSL